MYNRLTFVDRLSHIEVILKIANDHKHLPGFSDRNVRGYLPSHNPNIPHRVRTPRPKNGATNAIDSPNELINASTSTHIETSSSTDMDYDATKISPLQLDKRGQIAPSPSPPPTMTSNSTIDHSSSQSDNDELIGGEILKLTGPLQNILELQD